MTDHRVTTLAQRVRKYREAKGLSLSDLAKVSGISRSYLYQLESGDSSPTEEKLVALAKALEVSVSDLVSNAEESSDTPESLAEFARQDNLPPSDVKMLQGINYRGRRPTSVGAWRILYSVIKAATQQEERSQE